MAFRFDRTRRLPALRRGDIININVPFEENTRDYYNGYKPSEIRDEPFTDRFGKSSKTRMVVYIGRNGKDMFYLPITSKCGAPADSIHQYELKNVSMMPKGKIEKRSFVEVDSMRAISISYQRDLPYTGYLGKEDLDNILHRLANATLQFNDKRDRRGYIPADMEGTFISELRQQGYGISEDTEDQKTYEKRSTGQIVSRTKYGMVYYHYPLTKEQVKEMVEVRERGHTMYRIDPKDFIKSVNELSKQEERTYVTC